MCVRKGEIALVMVMRMVVALITTAAVNSDVSGVLPSYISSRNFQSNYPEAELV
jgi:hypothetical protein